MRQLASYSLSNGPGDRHSSATRDEVKRHVHEWLASKGKFTEADKLALHDGRLATVGHNTVASPQGSLSEWVLTEPTPGGWFRTSIGVAESPDTLAIHVGLSAGSSNLSPLSLDVHCPRIIRTLLALPVPWKYGGTPLLAVPVNFNDAIGGDDFIAAVWSPERNVPLVAISDEYGVVLHPGIVENLASDLAGLAIVARLNPAASWRVTARKGKVWSCYGSAIRLYWPGLEARPNPYDHPLWTPIRLLEGVVDTEAAAGRIRSQLRRRILNQSAFAISESPLFGQIRRTAREQEITALQTKVSEDADFLALAEDYRTELSKTQEVINQQEEEIAALKAQVANLQLALRWKDAAPEDIEPNLETPPSTVEEAVFIAMEKYHSRLIFGGAVDEGIASVAPDAGPPDKILSYLGTLSDLTEARRKGPLGTTAIKWLESRGIIASGESETVLKSPAAQKARTWDDGSGGKRAFNLHLKPSEATSPDRCVRVYFEYDEEQRKTVVAWVGKHP